MDRPEYTNDSMAFKAMEIMEDMRIRGMESDLSARIKPQFYSCNAEEMRITLAFNLEPWERNIKNTLHGGITATILDTTMGYLVHLFTGQHTSTINMDIYYLRPAFVGQTLLCEARIDKLGKNIVFSDCRLWVHGEEENIIATAKGTYTG